MMIGGNAQKRVIERYVHFTGPKKNRYVKRSQREINKQVDT
jgi:hypothetical protein